MSLYLYDGSTLCASPSHECLINYREGGVRFYLSFVQQFVLLYTLFIRRDSLYLLTSLVIASPIAAAENKRISYHHIATLLVSIIFCLFVLALSPTRVPQPHAICWQIRM